MTNWYPDLSRSSGPRAQAIAEILSADIAEGRLKPGERLPTHRDLAWRLSVSIGTVTRAYAEAERRGLIAGEVGRGTYVKASGPIDQLRPVPQEREPAVLDMAHNYPPRGAHREEIAAVMRELAGNGRLDDLLGYQTDLGRREHRAAAVRWMGLTGVTATPETAMLTNGAQDALHLGLTAFTRPGDTVLTEELTFYGVKSVASHLSLRLTGVAMDRNGLVPDALDAACRATNAKALYAIPTLQNPTVSVMPTERRREIAEICRRHDLVLLEDDIYGILPDPPSTPIATFAPERTIYFSSLSKSIAPALRLGFVHAPDEMIERLARALRSSTLMANPLTAEIGTRLIEDGTAERLVGKFRRELQTRQTLARRAFDGLDVVHHSNSYHLWMHLPEHWRREEYTAEARSQGIAVAPADAFAVGRTAAPHAVRVCLALPPDHATLERALRTLADLARDHPKPRLPIV